jgi:hypothetical protein
MKLLRGANVALIAYGQLVTAFRAPTRQYSPAIRRFHAHTEPVRLRPVTVVRLKSTFRHRKILCLLF